MTEEIKPLTLREVEGRLRHSRVRKGDIVFRFATEITTRSPVFKVYSKKSDAVRAIKYHTADWTTKGYWISQPAAESQYARLFVWEDDQWKYDRENSFSPGDTHVIVPVAMRVRKGGPPVVRYSTLPRKN